MAKVATLVAGAVRTFAAEMSPRSAIAATSATALLDRAGRPLGRALTLGTRGPCVLFAHVVLVPSLMPSAANGLLSASTRLGAKVP